MQKSLITSLVFQFTLPISMVGVSILSFAVTGVLQMEIAHAMEHILDNIRGSRRSNGIDYKEVVKFNGSEAEDNLEEWQKDPHGLWMKQKWKQREKKFDRINFPVVPMLRQLENFITREKKDDNEILTTEDLRNYFVEHADNLSCRKSSDKDGFRTLRALSKFEEFCKAQEAAKKKESAGNFWLFEFVGKAFMRNQQYWNPNIVFPMPEPSRESPTELMMINNGSQSKEKTPTVESTEVGEKEAILESGKKAEHSPIKQHLYQADEKVLSELDASMKAIFAAAKKCLICSSA
uniref:Uncharacterized protein n=1 Tax=Ditylenchus dipsaci TaxID=166011 RepID=A0A915E8U8_9BILA